MPKSSTNSICLIALAYVFVLISCSQSSEVNFENQDLEITYVYDSQILLWEEPYSIARTVKIANKNSNQKVQFELFDDIENLDEPRFFICRDIEFQGNKYNQTIVIKDPFAYVIVDLSKFQVIYNSHGEDLEYKKYKEGDSEICIGKITANKFLKGNCKIEF